MKYQILLSDCPWQYRNKRTGGSMLSGASAVYAGTKGNAGTMSTDQLLALGSLVKQVTYDTAVHLMWATKPFLLDALAVNTAWGFDYKTFLGWDKARYGMGFWFRGQEELLILGVRKPSKPFRSRSRDIQLAADVEAALNGEGPLAALLDSEALIQSKRGAHSAKPQWQYDVADVARCGQEDRHVLEIFARDNGNVVPAWVDQTGLEIDGRDVSEALALAAQSKTRDWTARKAA